MYCAQNLTRALRGVWHGHYGSARCPAHDDQWPSLSLSNGHDGRLLLTCYAGCSLERLYKRLEELACLENKSLLIKLMITHSLSQNSLAETYLRNRGITCELPADLRFQNKCPHPLGMTLPALVALLRGLTPLPFIEPFYKLMAVKQIRNQPKPCWILSWAVLCV
ncbi:DUF7146 domain-containing protein [Bartonella krasnovii]|uniref:DUF7146 domain-containing protein n=1 Tax=Bartonella krasnovii TaxID=2267275 RepID=UPI003B97F6F6